MNSINADALKSELRLARTIAAEVYGENPPPELVAAVLNGITAQKLDKRLNEMTSDLCRAAAVAAGE